MVDTVLTLFEVFDGCEFQRWTEAIHAQWAYLDLERRRHLGQWEVGIGGAVQAPRPHLLLTSSAALDHGHLYCAGKLRLHTSRDMNGWGLANP